MSITHVPVESAHKATPVSRPRASSMRSVVEDRIMQSGDTPLSYTFMVRAKESAAFAEKFSQALTALETDNRSDVMRTAMTLGMEQIVNPTVITDGGTPTTALPEQTIRNLAMLGSLLVAVRRMPQVAAALSDTIETTIDAISRDLDALSAILDA